ncbi:DNA phosphorothioation-dependent restriction protein DptH [Methanosphaera sp.]
MNNVEYNEEFYDYLSNKLIDYFKENNNISEGLGFYIHFDEKYQVEFLYNSLKKIANENRIYSEFKYTHKNSETPYNTYSIKINDVKLVIAAEINDITHAFFTTLRNQVKKNKTDDDYDNVWENTALLVIYNNPIDSIQDGMENLEKKGRPFHVDSISNSLEDDINNSELSREDKEIVKFSLKEQDEDLYSTTIWDYENILGIINKGYVDDKDYKELELFKDDNLTEETARNIQKNLKENHETFLEVKKYSQYGDKKAQLEKRFSGAGVKELNKDTWEQCNWKKIKRSKDDYEKQQKPLNYIKNTDDYLENGLPYWERPNNSGKAGQRKRNIIIFNTQNVPIISLKFTFDQLLSNQYLSKSSKKFVKASGKSLKAQFDVYMDEPTFKTISYKHKDDTKSSYTFNIVVLNAKPEIFEYIKSRYTIKTRDKYIQVINDEDNYEIKFGENNNITEERSISKKDEKVNLYDNTSIKISESSPEWEDGELNFKLIYNDNEIKFKIKEKSNRARPVKSQLIWNLKRENAENFVFNDVKAIQGVNSFYLDDNFKKYLRYEREIIENNIFHGKLTEKDTISKEEVHYSEELETAYLDIFKYYQNFDDSQEDNIPSLVYLNDELRELYRKFLDIYNKEIESIEENSILADIPDKKDLIKLGRIDDEDKIMYSSLSPLNMAYQLELFEQCGNEQLEFNMSERLVPNNLIPFLCSDDGETLYRPIYQEDAHEWTIYEKIEQVSIGTTNVFISKVVSEKLDQFVKHFDYLFDINPHTPIKINLINILDDKEVVKGIFQFIRSRLPDKLKTKTIIPVEINIYSDSDKSSFDKLFECNSKDDIETEFGITIKSDVLDEIDVIHSVQDNIQYYKHKLDEDYDYAHISFYKVKSHTGTATNNMDEIETGLSLNGLLSSVNSTTKHAEYRTGFGTKNTLNYDNNLVKTAINLNDLVEGSRNYGKDTYSKHKVITTTVELEEENISLLYDKSHWVTFIEPTFGIEYFNEDDNLIIIHYSDQYSYSNNYDTITVTDKLIQYEEIIKEFLENKDVTVDDEDLISIIKMFNCINGAWLLRLISTNGYYDREKLSIISAINYALALFDHEDIKWIPISMEEILRIAGNVKLDKSQGVFSSLLSKGSYSDDILLIGFKTNKNNLIEIIFYPIEVKVGQNNQQIIKKGKQQIIQTYNALNNQLRQIGNEDNKFKNKFLRNFFIQNLLSTENKLTINNIWDEKHLDSIDEFKPQLLNDEYVVSKSLEEHIGKGCLISFKSDCPRPEIYTDVENNIKIIELPEDRAYSGLTKSIEQLRNIIQSGDSAIHTEDLIFSEELNDYDLSRELEDISEEMNDVFDEPIEDNTFIQAQENSVKINDFESSQSLSRNYDDIDNVEENIIDDEEITAPEINESDELDYVRALIGTQAGYNKDIYWEFGSKSLGNRHMLIQGKSGQGKTYFIQRMLKELSNHNIPSIVIDYTDGFKDNQLDDNFKESLGDKLEQHVIYGKNFPLNPFKPNLIEINGTIMPERNNIIAGRFKSVVNSVYTALGDQQLNAIYDAVLRGLDKYGETMDLNDLKHELEYDNSKVALSALSRLRELLEFNPFESTDYDWSDILDQNDGKVLIIQLTGIPKDVQKIITELILWDLWYYKTNQGTEDNPFVVVLDEIQNLNFKDDSPCKKIITEGRKFGWSGWFATQDFTDKNVAKLLENAEEKIYFHPTDTSISTIAKNLDNSDKTYWENQLAKLKKGQCIVKSPLMNSNGEVTSSSPIVVDVNEITSKSK